MEMRLQELRKITQKTQEEVAKQLNLQKQTYQNYELKKREPSIETLIKLADYYNVSLDYMVGRVYGDDIGYLTPEQKTCVKIIKKLNDKQTERAERYLLSILLGDDLIR